MKSIWLKILLGIVIVIAAISITLNIYMDKWLSIELTEILNNNPDRKNDITFEDFTIHILLGNLSIHNVGIIPISSDSTQKPLMSVEEFGIRGVSFYKLFTNKEISTRTLIIKKPTVNFRVKAKQKIVGDSKEINTLWKDILTRINVKNFEIEEGTLSIYDEIKDKEQVHLSPINLIVKNIIIDTTTIDDPFPLKYSSINLNGANLDIDMDDFILKAAKFEVTESTLNIEELTLSPKTETKRPQIMTIGAKSIDITHFSWGFMEEQFYLKINTISANEANVSVLKNKHVPPTLNEKHLLPTLLRELPFKMHIDSVVVKNSTIVYEQLNEDETETGQIRFHNFYSTGYNITNLDDALAVNEYATIDVETDFMQKGHLKSQFKFHTTHEHDNFEAFGSINSMDIAEFNAILGPLAGVNVTGQLIGFNYDISGNKWNSKGSVHFTYNNLSVEVYGKDKENKNRFLSGLSKLVINGNNRKDQGNYKIGTVSAAKIRNKSFFVYLWESLKTGIIEIVAPAVNTDKKKKKKRK